VTHDQIEAMTLADRVVVMKGGVVQQVGSPTDIYDHPANTFVASFIGNPAMNLMEGTMEGGVFTASIPKSPAMTRRTAPRRWASGPRMRASCPSGGQINAPIYTLELLGDATMVTVRVKGALVSVRADKNFRAEIDDMVSIAVPAEICHLFDGKAVSE
jgi:multiple sugar transport system ATP-binding protein